MKSGQSLYECLLVEHPVSEVFDLGLSCQVVEQASVCLTRIAEAFATSAEKLDALCSHGLIAQTARLISVGNSSGSLIPQASLSSSTYTVSRL